jgi:hypothetical protein
MSRRIRFFKNNATVAYQCRLIDRHRPGKNCQAERTSRTYKKTSQDKHDQAPEFLKKFKRASLPPCPPLLILVSYDHVLPSSNVPFSGFTSCA